jgi:hypothetical protein
MPTQDAAMIGKDERQGESTDVVSDMPMDLI